MTKVSESKGHFVSINFVFKVNNNKVSTRKKMYITESARKGEFQRIANFSSLVNLQAKFNETKWFLFWNLSDPGARNIKAIR